MTTVEALRAANRRKKRVRIDPYRFIPFMSILALLVAILAIWRVEAICGEQTDLILQLQERQEEQAAHMEAIDAWLVDMETREQSLGEFTVTHYCCETHEHICGTGTGITASGIPVRPGLVAVDPSVIPLGSTVMIDGVEYLAADTGGSIKGNRIDIAVETHEQALNLGKYKAEVYLVEKGAE